MQVFKTFFKISLRFLPSTIVYIVIYGVLSLVLPNVQGKSANMIFEAEKINVAVIDNDNSTLSKALYEYIDNNHTIRDIGDDEERWRDSLYYRRVAYILIIDEGMENKILSGNDGELFTAYEDKSSDSSYIISSQVNSYISTLKGYIATGCSVDDAIKQTDDTVAKSAEVSFLNAETPTEKASAVSFYFTYAPYIMLCMLINSLGPMLVIWNRPEIKQRTSISSLSLTSRTGALIGAAAAFSILLFVMLIIYAVIMFRGDFFNKTVLIYLLNTFIYMLVCVSLTFLISQVTKHVNLLNMWSNVIGLSTSFLCGVFVQRSLLPDKVVAFSKCMPTYWYINVVEELRFFDGSLSQDAWMNMGIQLLYALAFFAMALVVVRFREQRASV